MELPKHMVASFGYQTAIPHFGQVVSGPGFHGHRHQAQAPLFADFGEVVSGPGFHGLGEVVAGRGFKGRGRFAGFGAITPDVFSCLDPTLQQDSVAACKAAGFPTTAQYVPPVVGSGIQVVTGQSGPKTGSSGAGAGGAPSVNPLGNMTIPALVGAFLVWKLLL